MKDYAEIYVSLREEIMQAIDEKVDSILAKYDVESLSDIKDMPSLSGYVRVWFDNGNGSDELVRLKVNLVDIFVGGECAGYVMDKNDIEPYSLSEFITDSLIDFYEQLCEL